MSEHEKNEKQTCTLSGWTRRSLLRHATLATAGVSATALLPGVVQGSANTAKATPPKECSKFKAPLQDVEGKVAFVTGGEGAIGLGLVRAFTDAGMKVAIGYYNQAQLDDATKYLDAVKDRVHAVRIDVTDRESMKQAARRDGAGLWQSAPVGEQRGSVAPCALKPDHLRRL